MGCSPSRVNPQGNEAMTPRPMPADKKANGHAKNGQVKKMKMDSNANQKDVNTNNPVPKAVAFQVTLDGEQTESLISKHPPIKLKRLAPLNVPTLSAEELLEKQKIADEKREKELQRKRSASKKSSRRRRELLQAKEFVEKQQMEKEKNKIDTSMKTAEMLREAKLQEVRERQRLREERARRARERHKKMANAEQEDIGTMEVERDGHFNADDNDSWLDDGKDGSEEDFVSGTGERIYSGNVGPEESRTGTNSTGKSNHDADLSRKPPSASSHLANGKQDDFFDS
ncbi:ensconsin-like [Saccostrea echinata]|uniref:ensconsin-like n=1 Tax=Saccostrea echinata TaxID=191078 RepID=UPI002A7FE92A|nr:ensconsin-like [Saccostrea echinata]